MKPPLTEADHACIASDLRQVEALLSSIATRISDRRGIRADHLDAVIGERRRIWKLRSRFEGLMSETIGDGMRVYFGQQAEAAR